MSKRDQNTENFLFDSIRSGNIEAYEVLFKKYYLSMCIVACRLIGDEDIAKDITQEVFIHLWEKRESYDFKTTPDIFLYVAVKNKCFYYLKKQKKMPIQNSSETADREYFFRNLVIEEETYRIVNEAIDALPVQSRRIIKLSLEGKQNKEIAEELGISTNTVKSLKYKAINVLRVALKDYYYLLLFLFPKI